MDVWSWVHLKKHCGYPVTIKPASNSCGEQKAAFVIRDNWRHRHDIEHAYLEAINQAHMRNHHCQCCIFCQEESLVMHLKMRAQRGVTRLNFY